MPMNTLAAQQQALLAALFDWPPQEAVIQLKAHATGTGADPGRGLKAYQAHGHMLAERALRAAYPVMHQLLGESSFADLARAFWHTCPPVHGDIAVWGERLAEFVGQSVQLQGEPYLTDVARVEWALHRCASAPDREANVPSLALLTTEDPQALTLHLAPGVYAFSSTWPLASLLLAHLEHSPPLEEVGAQLRSHTPQDVVVWRVGFQPRLRQALAGEAILLQALHSDLALGPALDAAAGLDFSLWLPLAVQTGLVLGAGRLAAALQAGQRIQAR